MSWPEYYNDPVEFNAYYQQLANDISDFEDLGIFYDGDIQDMRDFNKFLVYAKSIAEKDWIKHLNPKMNKHFIKRLYNLYQTSIAPHLK